MNGIQCTNSNSYINIEHLTTTSQNEKVIQLNSENSNSKNIKSNSSQNSLLCKVIYNKWNEFEFKTNQFELCSSSSSNLLQSDVNNNDINPLGAVIFKYFRHLETDQVFVGKHSIYPILNLNINYSKCKFINQEINLIQVIEIQLKMINNFFKLKTHIKFMKMN